MTTTVVVAWAELEIRSAIIWRYAVRTVPRAGHGAIVQRVSTMGSSSRASSSRRPGQDGARLEGRASGTEARSCMDRAPCWG